MNTVFHSITYSEFDNIVGPRLIYQVPTNVISSEAFESVSDYVIVGHHLCGKVIGIKLEQFHYINCCVAIDNKKVS